MKKQVSGWVAAWCKSIFPVVGGVLLLSSGAAMAVPSSTWYGTVSTAWNNRTNWTPSYDIPGSIQSVPASGANIIISQGCTNYPVVTNNLTVGAVSINQTNGSLTVSKGTFTVSSMSVGSGNGVTISLGAAITSSGTVTAGGTWNVSGSLTGAVTAVASTVFTINPGAVVNASSGGANLNSGGGTLYIYGTFNDGANALVNDGFTTISNGSLICGPLTVPGYSISMQGGTLSSGPLTIDGGSLYTGSSAVMTNGPFNMSSGYFQITNASVVCGPVSVTGGGGEVDSGGTLTTTGPGASTMNGGSFTMNSGGTATFSGSLTSDNNAFIANPGSTVTILGGIGANSGYTINGGTFYISGGNQTIPSGTFTNLTLSSTGTFTLDSGVSIAGNLAIGTGSIVSLASGTVIPVGTLSLSGTNQDSGTWGSTSSSATHKNNTYFAGAGNLNVYTKSTVSTTTTLGALTTENYGSKVIFTAGVSPASASGTIQFETNGVAVGSPVTLVAGSASLTNSTLPAGSYSVTAVYSGASGFNASTSGSSTQTVNKVTVTISGLTANNKVYDGTTAGTLNPNSATLTGVISGDSGNVQLSTNGCTVTFSRAGIGSGLAVTASGLTLTGSAAANYSLTQPSGLTASITAAPVTVSSGIGVNSKVYSATSAATITSNNVVLSGVVSGDTANVRLSTNGYTATFAGSSVGTGVAVTISGLTLTGSVATNYSLTQPSGLTADITPVTVTISSGVTVSNKVYNGTTAATIVSNNVALNGVLAADTASVRLSTNDYTATFASASAGSGIAVTVGGLTLTGSAAGNYTLTQLSGLTANITAAGVTISSGIAVNGKVYDGTTACTISSNNVVLSGVASGDTANVSLSTNGYSATFASANVGTGIAVTVGGLTLTGSAAANYTLTQPAGLTASITAIPVTISSGITANSKVYTATTAATVSSNNVVLSGVISADTANVHLSTNGYTAAFASANVGNDIGVTVGGLTLTGSAAANYTLAQPSGLTANITSVGVTITSGLAAANKAYDGTTVATISSNNVALSGVLAADTANVHLSTNGYSAAFASSSVGTGISVAVSGLTLAGSAAANYTLTQPTLAANITAIPVTVSGVTANNKAYDGTTAATISSGSAVLNGVLVGDSANVHLSAASYTATFASASAGTGIVVTVGGLTLTGSAAANYTLTQPSGLTANITAIPVTISSGVTANNKVYTGTTAAGISVGTVVFSGVIASDSSNVHLATNGYTATFASANVGTGISVAVTGLTLTGSAAGNYTLTQPTLSANITSASVTIAAGVTANSKPYDGTTAGSINVNSVTLSGVASGDTANVSLSTNGYSATFASANVGNNLAVTVSGLTLTGSAAANYTLTQPSGLTANITAIPVTIASGITANNKVYTGTTAATISSNNVVLNGVVASDSASIHLSTNGYSAVFASANVGNGVAVTVSGLTLTGSAAANYTFTQPAGLTASITAGAVTITSGITANNKAYDGTTAATITQGSVVLSGVQSGDSANVHLSTNGYSAVFASANVGNGVAVTVGGLTLTGSAAANYTLTQPALSANITALTVTVASGITVDDKAYNGTNSATITSNNVALTGVITADAQNVQLSTNNYTAKFASASVGTNLAVTISGLTLTGSAAANYTLTQPAGLTADITPISVTVASGITVNNKVYNGSTAATITTGTIVFSGVLSQDSANVHLSTSGYSAAFATAAAGSEIPVTISGLTLTGSAAGDYTLVQPTGLTADITAIGVTVSSGLTANNKIYDGTTAATLNAGTVVLNGVLAGDTANVALATNGYTAVFATAPVGSGIGVTVSGLTLTGSAAGNYTLTQPHLTANITAAPVTVVSGLTANDKAYNGSTTATISSNNVVLGGVVASDASSVHLSTNGYTASFASAAVGSGIVVTVSGLTLTGSAAANYTLTQPAGLTANITSGTVTITSGVTANNKVYDGNTAATITLSGVSLSGVSSGDSANVHVSTNGYTATFASSSAGNGIAVTVGGLTLTGSAAANYTLTQPVLSAKITAAPVTIASGITADNKAYNGNNAATISSNNVVLNGVIDADAANVALSTNGYTATFASSGAANNIAVTVGGLTLTGSAAGNYALSQPAGLTANITQMTLAITSPTSGQILVTNSDMLTFKGTVSGNGVVTNVWLSLDGINWTGANSTNGWTNWYAALSVGAGAQTVYAYAADIAGNVSTTNKVSFTITHTGGLTVLINGTGTVSPNYNGQALEIGQTYSMTASGQSGWVFANWTSSLSSTNFKTAGLTFTMASNLVLTATFTNAVIPTIAVSSPSNGQQIVTNSPVLTFIGTASGNVPLAGVFVSLDGVNWTNANTANGWTNWNLTLPVAAGTTTFRAYALDSTGNYSHTNNTAFTIIHTGALLVSTNGAGTVSPNYNGQVLKIGQNYSMTASGAAGWKFSSWSSSLLPPTNTATLNFTMASNLALTANFAYTIPPKLFVTALTNHQVLVTNASTTTVRGSASSAVPITGVWVSIGGASFTEVTTTNGFTNWITVLPIATGSQVLESYAVDSYGNNSGTNILNFEIARTAYMTVVTNGNGTIYHDWDNQYLQVGGVYTMTATGRNGWTFTNWTSNLLPAGEVLSNSPTLTFIMQSNLVITGNFVDLSRPTANLNLFPAGVHGETNQWPFVINSTTTPAADNSLVTGVWVSFNSNAWQSASTSNNWANWTATMVAQRGTNNIRAYCQDAVGNYSLTNSLTFTHTDLLPLTVVTNQSGTTGLGSISMTTNGQPLVVGNKYYIKATPASGCVFSNWTSNLLPTTSQSTWLFTMASNLVLSANFLDNTKPTISISSPANGAVVSASPANGAVVSASPATVSGLASDNVGVAYVWYSVNSNDWQRATGTSNWMTSIAVQAGTNSFRAYSQDAAGNKSPTNVVAIKYSVPVPLTIITNGLGGVSGLQSAYYYGQTYSFTASPSRGFTFSNWTGNLVPSTTSTTIKFTMVSNLVLTVNFRDSSVPSVTIAAPSTTRLTNSTFTVTGTASDNWALGGVYCQVNNGNWVLTSTSNGYTNWYETLTLVPGTNVIRAYAVDYNNLYSGSLTRYSTTNSLTVYFLTAPFTPLSNLRAVVTPDDGSQAYEMDFGPTSFGQYAWGTNNLNAAGNYTYTNTGITTGVLDLDSFALPQNTYSQTVQLTFTNRYMARLSYTNDSGQTVDATAAFTAISNVAPSTVSGQTLVSVDAFGNVVTNNLLTNGVSVQIYGTEHFTNGWTYATYGPYAGLLTVGSGGQTNWWLVHYEVVHAGEFAEESSDGTQDIGLIGFLRPSSSGNAPASGSLDGHSVLANYGDSASTNADTTLSAITFSGGRFSLTTSDDSSTGAGSYNYTQINPNVGQLILNYTGGFTATNLIQFPNPNFGISTNSTGSSTGVSGLIFR